MFFCTSTNICECVRSCVRVRFYFWQCQHIRNQMSHTFPLCPYMSASFSQRVLYVFSTIPRIKLKKDVLVFLAMDIFSRIFHVVILLVVCFLFSVCFAVFSVSCFFLLFPLSSKMSTFTFFMRSFICFSSLNYYAYTDGYALEFSHTHVKTCGL